MTTELVPADSATLDLHYAGVSFDDLVHAGQDTLQIDGLTLVDKSELLGVPFAITRVSYWTPLKGQLGMVSIEATVGGQKDLAKAISRGLIPNVTNLGSFRLDPNERIVFNDGSTGVRRQITKLLQEHGLLNVGKAPSDGDARFDTPWPDWAEFKEARTQSQEVGAVPSFSRRADGAPLIIVCWRGLAVSKYSNDYADEAETYYLR